MGSIMMTRVMRGLKFWWFLYELPLRGLPEFPRYSISILSGLDVACARFVHIVHCVRHCASYTLCAVCSRLICKPTGWTPCSQPPITLLVNLAALLVLRWNTVDQWTTVDHSGTQWNTVNHWSTVEDRVCPWFSSPIELAVMLGRHVPHSQEGINQHWHICPKPPFSFPPKWSHGSYKRCWLIQCCQQFRVQGRCMVG